METYDRLVEKWSPVLNESSAGDISDAHRKAVTAVVLENTEKALREERNQANFLSEASPATSSGNSSVANWDPVLISLVRRAMPNMMAYDVCGVQPMAGPTGLIFAMKSRYVTGTTGATEALFNEADTTYAGDSGASQSSDPSGLSGLTDGDLDSTIDDSRGSNPTFGGGTTTAEAELSGAFRNMGFTIEKQTVTAKSRALKAEYSLELAQDLKAIHGLDAETELSNLSLIHI